MHKSFKSFIFTVLTISAFVATMVTLVNKARAADAIYVKGEPSGIVSKLEVIRGLAISKNKDLYLQCKPVKLDEDKGTVKSR